MMNKKLIGVLAALAVIGCTNVFAASKGHGGAAIGAQGGYVATSAGYGNLAATFKLPSVPPVFAVDLGIGGGEVHSFGVTADWWIANPTISGALGWYYAPGLALGLDNLNTFNFYVGGRVVLGLNVFVISPLELYAQVAAELGFNSGYGFYWHLPINAGFRFWF